MFSFNDYFYFTGQSSSVYKNTFEACKGPYAHWVENRAQLHLAQVNSPTNGNYFITVTSDNLAYENKPEDQIHAEEFLYWPSAAEENQSYWVEQDTTSDPDVATVMSKYPAYWKDVSVKKGVTKHGDAIVEYQAYPRYYNLLNEKWEITMNFQSITSLYNHVKNGDTLTFSAITENNCYGILVKYNSTVYGKILLKQL